MNGFKTLNPRRLSIAGFSFLFAYILSFQFEGQVLYGLLVLYGADFQRYILAIIAFYRAFHLRSVCRVSSDHKSIMLGIDMLLPLPSFYNSILWVAAIIGGYASGFAAAWGYFLRALRPITGALNPAPTF